MSHSGKRLDINSVVIVSPDPGRVKRARALAKRLSNVPIAIIDKRRPEPNKSEVIHVIGNVRDKICIINDDIVDTGGTLIGAAEAILKNGAKAVYATITHPVLSGDASIRITNSSIKEMIVTNTIPLHNKKTDKFTVLSVGTLLAEAIKRIHKDESVSSLFD